MTGHPRVYPEYKTTTWCTHNPPEEPCSVCEQAARGSKPEPRKTQKKKPVCDTCNDTHVMVLGERTVMCTRCPTPCQKCRAGGNGPYCAKTPCACACHKKRKEVPLSRSMGELVRAYERLKLLTSMLTSVRIALDEAGRGVPVGMDLPQALMMSAQNVAETLIRLDAYSRIEDDRKPRQDMGRFSDRAIEGAVVTCREAFRNDGAEGESVHLVCDALLDARAELEKTREKMKELLAHARRLEEKLGEE